jgi:hypothetical protein
VIGTHCTGRCKPDFHKIGSTTGHFSMKKITYLLLDTLAAFSYTIPVLNTHNVLSNKCVTSCYIYILLCNPWQDIDNQDKIYWQIILSWRRVDSDRRHQRYKSLVQICHDKEYIYNKSFSNLPFETFYYKTMRFINK